jgi:hypothetical protein
MKDYPYPHKKRRWLDGTLPPDEVYDWVLAQNGCGATFSGGPLVAAHAQAVRSEPSQSQESSQEQSQEPELDGQDA